MFSKCFETLKKMAFEPGNTSDCFFAETKTGQKDHVYSINGSTLLIVTNQAKLLALSSFEAHTWCFFFAEIFPFSPIRNIRIGRISSHFPWSHVRSRNCGNYFITILNFFVVLTKKYTTDLMHDLVRTKNLDYDIICGVPYGAIGLATVRRI